MHCAAIFVRRVVHFLDGLRNGANQARGGCAGASGRRRPCRPRRRCVEASTHRLQLLHQSLSFALVLQGIDDLIERLRQRRWRGCRSGLGVGLLGHRGERQSGALRGAGQEHRHQDADKPGENWNA
jgi:hypothetical protein